MPSARSASITSVTLAPEGFGIDLDGIEVPGAPAPGRPWRKADSRDVAEHGVVAVGDLAAFGDDIVEAAELRCPEGCLQCGDAVVVAEHGHVVFPERAGALIGGAGHPMIAQLANRDQRCTPSAVRHAPPSPVVICFTGWKLSVVISASDPTGRPPSDAPSECALSAMIGSGRGSAALIAGDIGGQP